jgi:pimeloyl-ACP methyl ester carboxylesterase
MPRLHVLLPTLLAALLLVPAASAKAPPGDLFYTPPSPLPGRAHGDLIWFRNQDPASNLKLAAAARNLLVLYRSTGVSGGPVAESGAVAIPKGKPPKGGWPVVTWAHGTTGLADQCAPTRQPFRSDVYAVNLRAQFDAYLRSGYAVVATDYEGLGTPGVHPYLVGTSEGRSVLDMARAARKLDRHIGRSVAIIGHSQGGHAALWAAYLAPRYTPELKVKATVAFAPASHIKDQFNLLYVLKDPSPISGLIASIFRGADVAYPSLHVGSLLTDQAAALYPEVDQECLSALTEPDSFGGIAPDQILRPGVDSAPFLAAADKSDPENLAIKTPVMIVQGTADNTVVPLFTEQLVNELRQHGAKVVYKKFPGVNHNPIVAAGGKVARAYVKKRIGR